MGNSNIAVSIRSLNVSEVLAAISGDYSLHITKTLESTTRQYDSNKIKEELKLSKKQFYTAIAHLSNVGIIKRNNGVYHLTSFGKLILNSVILVEDSMKIYSKLKAIDAIGNSKKDISREEIMKLINVLIDNDRVRELVKLNYSL